MSSDPRHRNALSKVRSLLLDSVSFYQHALVRNCRTTLDEAVALEKQASKWEETFKHHRELGWPSQFVNLGHEADHLAARFRREFVERFPSRSRRSERRGDREDTERFCA